jgi:hypothetical protein
VEDRKDAAHLIGEALREVAVLFLVFYPLEAYFQDKFTWWGFLIIVGLVVILFYRGVILELGEWL